jgi:hypothetical protein
MVFESVADEREPELLALRGDFLRVELGYEDADEA